MEHKVLNMPKDSTSNSDRSDTKSENSSEDHIVNYFTESYVMVEQDQNGKERFQNVSKKHVISTERKVPKVGVMLVGLGGNNGSTFTAGILANKYKTTW